MLTDYHTFSWRKGRTLGRMQMAHDQAAQQR